MKQRSLAESGYERRPKATKRQRFLTEMDAVMPWTRPIDLVDPVQPKLGTRGGRASFPAETMLRIHFMQQWFALSDPGMEEALHDIPALRAFARLDAGNDLIPDESSILRFRHRLEQHGLADRLLAEVNALLSERGLLLRQGTIVDATLINAPSSAKNQDRVRDPEMHQTKKGNQWFFGMKAHIGVDAESGLTHTVVTTPANVNDVTQAHACLHGDETDVFGDAGYQGAVTCVESGKCIVILNTPHSPRRQASDLMHELVHRIRQHKTREVEISATGLMLVHDYDKAQEEEADWLSGCLLLPREALISIKRRHLELPDAALAFGASQRMLTNRLAMTGVSRQFA